MRTLTDSCGRRISYLRISITDQCNLRWTYCTPEGTLDHFDRVNILSFEEIVTAVRAAVSVGINKIRLTGGEPLVRKDMINLCRMLNRIDGLKALTLTTNGVRLEEMADSLKAAGIRRVNVSLDSIRSEQFKIITGKNLLGRVLTGIESAEKAGLCPVKINMVVMRGINDDEIEDLARWTLKKPYHIRFIELMPTAGWTGRDHRKYFVPSEEIIQRIQRMGPIRLIPAIDTLGPARLYRLRGAIGCIGLITPVTHHFCSACNRIRLTADGHLKTCLFGSEEIDIKAALRSGASHNEIASLFRRAAAEKHRHHSMSETSQAVSEGRAMRAIGG